MAETESLLETPLGGLHRALGGRMVGFAGYAMPVQYPAGIMAEHLHCRAAKHGVGPEPRLSAARGGC